MICWGVETGFRFGGSKTFKMFYRIVGYAVRKILSQSGAYSIYSISFIRLVFSAIFTHFSFSSIFQFEVIKILIMFTLFHSYFYIRLERDSFILGEKV